MRFHCREATATRLCDAHLAPDLHLAAWHDAIPVRHVPSCTLEQRWDLVIGYVHRRYRSVTQPAISTLLPMLAVCWKAWPADIRDTLFGDGEAIDSGAVKKAVHDLLHNAAYYDYIALKLVAAKVALASNDSTALKLAAAKMALASSDGVRCPPGMLTRTRAHIGTSTLSRADEQARTCTCTNCRLSCLGRAGTRF